MFYRKDIEALMERKAADGGVSDRAPGSGAEEPEGPATLPGLGKAGE